MSLNIPKIYIYLFSMCQSMDMSCCFDIEFFPWRLLSTAVNIPFHKISVTKENTVTFENIIFL